MNITLIAKEGVAIVPPVADPERLPLYLDDAGPDPYDAESLREHSSASIQQSSGHQEMVSKG